MKAVFKRELKSYFQGFTGYLFIAFLLLIIGIFTVLNNLRNASPKFEYVLADVGFVFLLTVPMLTMRVFSEEKRQKTDQLLYSLPLKTTDIVFGKYFAMLTILAIPTLVMCFYPLILSSYGPIGFLTAYSSIFAFFLQGAGLIAIGMFVSSLTENQIVSAGLSFAVLLVLFLMPTFVSSLSASALASLIAFSVVAVLIGVIAWFMTKNSTVSVSAAMVLETPLLIVYFVSPATFEGAFQRVIYSISIFMRLYNFIEGIFDVGSVIFFLSAIFLFCFLTIQSLEKRRYS